MGVTHQELGFMNDKISHGRRIARPGAKRYY
jgi:hypothetical protein